MSEQKKLLINCDICDTRSMREEDYADYEKIVINTDFILVSEASKSILNRLPVTLNHDRMFELPDGQEIHQTTVNGKASIEKGTKALPHTFLVVNGALTIAPDADEALQNYDSIIVNGFVRYPDSLDTLLSLLTVNGVSEPYPADHVLLDSQFVLDAYFPLRARPNGKYYARSAVIVKDPAVDLNMLREKNVSFRTKAVVTLAEHVEVCAALFDEQAEFIVVPTGMALIHGDCTIDAALLKKHGSRLFVYGDAHLGDGFESLEKLIVTGTLRLTEAQRDGFESLDATYGALKFPPKERVLSGLSVRIDMPLIDASPDGVLVQNAPKAILAEDIMPKTILETLRFKNCAHVDCSEQQESSVASVSENVAHIGRQAAVDENDPQALLKKSPDTRVVHADSYRM